ncbi:M3 family oligoendopeptidase [Paenibacillus alkaliterrae]|uniref:M3 family oligoendopeptidase n=1 Tax=Paenibacillus alkaliterrae TaxID=320909 RepID=UPI001F2BA6F7|nr:M3 family oligoendopeptidase [Paenibacillus alkaliterrae]MCF2941742.1 M3 family oligoendopeptidase [Paenibacillus alkaliterrae]
MKFQDFVYQRPSIHDLEKKIVGFIRRFEEAESYEKQVSIMEEIHELRTEYESMCGIAYIRYTIDTTDPFYKAEQDFNDESNPIYQGIVTRYYKALVGSKFRSELEQRWGKQLFRIAEMSLKTFSPEIVELLQRENKLCSEYTSLIASAKFVFEGEERNLPQLASFALSTDRKTRRKALEARTSFFIEHEAELDDLFDQLVKVRTEIAHKLGYSNFVELGYARLKRSDYSAADVANFREKVRKYIVPITLKLKERQRKRIGIDSLRYYDDSFSFKTGNAKPKGDPDQIVQNGKTMYAELSPETGEFFDMMIENELMDLLSKKGKAGGGYCGIISKYKAPFIFANFNGTSSDIDVLTHEAGHAFQVLCSLDYKVPEYEFPTAEAGEIHSMSMEFFAWPWMDLFFPENADKYRFSHMSDALFFIPNGVAYDEFQHFVYENPKASPADRKRAWRDIEKKYVPYRDYEGNDFLESGNLWLQNGHVFCLPFYYVDYTLARICSVQLWKKASVDRQAAWSDYMALCKAGGSRSFLELLEIGNLVSPFSDGCVESVTEDIESWLDRIDDQKL